ncbi:type II toxin-antitoxin system CcdA family antitoxin [Leucothrix arctica]|uniref:Acetoacetyl-CoA synthase n=1 Tax=Leucothrix arctica TaxID=1481894 RepID=A0A317C8E3_9GAMM|nr:type II toxin-antitoxin system CcdA family antitoxin [Leucothrix arctica]PWQ94599.1 acetoacetyl-CoA synthase [Leucothrix arctica]
MDFLYDMQAPKKATNLSINSDLLSRARSLNINLSSTLESVLKQLLAEEQAKQWKVENRKAVQAYNHFLEENGCFSDEYRTF